MPASSELRHIAIKERYGKFGFSDDTCNFSTIPVWAVVLSSAGWHSIACLQALVKHFEKESLAKYNHILETTLAYPYK